MLILTYNDRIMLIFFPFPIYHFLLFVCLFICLFVSLFLISQILTIPVKEMNSIIHKYCCYILNGH